MFKNLAGGKKIRDGFVQIKAHDGYCSLLAQELGFLQQHFLLG
jgi:hypothetical protein